MGGTRNIHRNVGRIAKGIMEKGVNSCTSKDSPH